VIEQIRDCRNRIRLRTPRVKARDIALEIYDAFTFTAEVTRLFIIDALTALCRDVIQEERARSGARAHAAAGAAAVARGTPEFPDFADICDPCPRNYALPADEPNETIYVETFDEDFQSLPEGYGYLRKFAEGAQRNATALENLYRLCRRLGGIPGDTPREILLRHGFTI
jgi:hypothetical protein